MAKTYLLKNRSFLKHQTKECDAMDFKDYIKAKFQTG